MNKIYRKSKIKVSLLLVTIALIFLTSISILSYFTKNKGSIIFIIFIFISLLIVSFYKIKAQFYEYLEVGDKLNFVSVPLSWHIEFNKIKRIDYIGTKILPMSEIMIIYSDVDIIHIDFNFYHYLDVWKEVIEVCLHENPDIKLSNKLKRRLKIVE